MVGTNKVTTTSRIPTRGEVAIQEFLNTNLTPRLLRQRTARLLNSKHLLRNVLGLVLEDQTRFVEKVDEVGRDGSFPSLKSFPPSLLQRYIRLSTCKT